MEQDGSLKYTQEDYEKSVIKLERERIQLESQIIVANKIRSLAKKIVEKVPSYRAKTILDVNSTERTVSNKLRQSRDPDTITESIPAWLLQTRYTERKDPESVSLRVTTEIYLDVNGNLWVTDNRINSHGSSNNFVERKSQAPRPITNEEIIPLSQATPADIPKVYETWVKSFVNIANVGSF